MAVSEKMEHVEKLEVTGELPDTYAGTTVPFEIDEATNKRLVREIEWRLMPVVRLKVPHMHHAV